MVYVMNTLIIPIDFGKYTNAEVKLKKISVEEAKKLLSEKPFTSAVGHESTALILTRLLGVEIPMQRKSIFFEPGDEGIHFFLRERLPEGKVLNEEEMKNLDFYLIHSQLIHSQ